MGAPDNCHLALLIRGELYIGPRRLNINHAVFGEKFQKCEQPEHRGGLNSPPGRAGIPAGWEGSAQLLFCSPGVYAWEQKSADISKAPLMGLDSSSWFSPKRKRLGYGKSTMGLGQGPNPACPYARAGETLWIPAGARRGRVLEQGVIHLHPVGNCENVGLRR